MGMFYYIYIRYKVKKESCTIIPRNSAIYFPMPRYTRVFINFKNGSKIAAGKEMINVYAKLSRSVHTNHTHTHAALFTYTLAYNPRATFVPHSIPQTSLRNPHPSHSPYPHGAVFLSSPCIHASASSFLSPRKLPPCSSHEKQRHMPPYDETPSLPPKSPRGSLCMRERERFLFDFALQQMFFTRRNSPYCCCMYD